MSRPLDTTESIFNVFHRVGSFTGGRALVFSGAFDAGIADEAIERLFARHPPLGWRIVGELDAAAFVPAHGRPPLTVISGAVPDAYRSVVERLVNDGLDDRDGFLWRPVVVRGASPDGPHALVLLTHHVLADGIAGARLMSEWLGELSALMRGTAPPVVRRPLDPRPDDVLPRPGVLAWLRHRLERRGKSASGVPVSAFDGRAEAANRRSAIVTGRVPLAALRDRARQQGTTIQGAAMSAMLGAARTELGVSDELTFSTPFDLRRLSPSQVPRGAVGCFVTSVVTRHRESVHQPF